MTRSMVSVVIDGDYIDSFVYSGALFLIDAEGVLRTYPWKELVAAALNRQNCTLHNSVFSLLTEGRNLAAQPMSNGVQHRTASFEIDSQLLANFEGASIDFGYWPTDINIYSSSLYVASEKGALKLGFSWVNGYIKEFRKPVVLWDEMAFRVSPNTMNRTAIAAGKAGVIAVTSNDHKDTSQIFESPCGDCDWHESTLIANTSDGPLIAEFEDIPKFNALLGSQDEYWKIVNAIKVKAPKSIDKIEINGEQVSFCWTGGDRLFAIDRQFQLYAAPESKKDPQLHAPLKFELVDNIRPGAAGKDSRFLSSRTGVFGTVVEFSDALFEISEGGMEKISDNPVRWRVFPRARNYANHLHIVEEHCLRINAFGANTGGDAFDRFGFALESIDEHSK